MRPLLRNVAALVLLTVVSGAALAWFAGLTADEVARNRLEAQTRILRELVGVELDALSEGDLVLCERGLVVLREAGSGYGGGFRLAVAVGLDGTIKGVRVLDHAETPGFGDILNTPSAWLDSFTSGDVHAVTGATITSDAVKAAVERAVQRVRLEEICPTSNESVGDGLVPSHVGPAATLQGGRPRALAGALGAPLRVVAPRGSARSWRERP